MKVRLDPMIVATSVHCRADGTGDYDWKRKPPTRRRAVPQKVCNVTPDHDVIGQADRSSRSQRRTSS
jgi:hypothetical protein